MMRSMGVVSDDDILQDCLTDQEWLDIVSQYYHYHILHYCKIVKFSTMCNFVSSTHRV